jgi:hypothetical protein
VVVRVRVTLTTTGGKEGEISGSIKNLNAAPTLRVYPKG